MPSGSPRTPSSTGRGSPAAPPPLPRSAARRRLMAEASRWRARRRAAAPAHGAPRHLGSRAAPAFAATLHRRTSVAGVLLAAGDAAGRPCALRLCGSGRQYELGIETQLGRSWLLSLSNELTRPYVADCLTWPCACGRNQSTGSLCCLFIVICLIASLVQFISNLV